MKEHSPEGREVDRCDETAELQAQRDIRVSRVLFMVVLGLVAATAVFEAGIALRWIPMGTTPGADPAGRDLALLVTVLGLLVGALMLFALTAAGSHLDRRFVLLGPFSAGLLVARFFSFDAYYLPTLRRMSTGGAVPGSLVAAVVALGIVAAVVTVRFLRGGQLLTALTMLLCAGLSMVASLGH
jgi:hypothetical protein